MMLIVLSQSCSYREIVSFYLVGCETEGNFQDKDNYLDDFVFAGKTRTYD